MSTPVQRRSFGAAVPPMSGRSAATVPSNPLSLVHVTAVGWAREIVRSGDIQARPCKVFGRDLAYFFLGRPAYRAKHDDQKSQYISAFPFAFVLSPTTLGTPFHVYPLDTGGLMRGVFGDHPNPHVFLEDYELSPPTLDAAYGHIEWAFGSAEAYFDGVLKPGLGDTLEHWDEVGRAFAVLAELATVGSNQPDKRASAIEIAYEKPIHLAGLKAFAVIPRQYIESHGRSNAPFVASLEALGISWEMYDWKPNRRPDDYAIDINRIIRAYLAGEGQI